MGIGTVSSQGFRSRAFNMAASFACDARRMANRGQILSAMVRTFAETFSAESVLYYDLNTSGRLRAHTSNREEFVAKSHVQDIRPDGPIKTVLDNEGFVFIDSITNQNPYLLLDRNRSLYRVENNQFDQEVAGRYLSDFGDKFKQSGEMMSIGFGCLGVPSKKFGVFKVDSFSSGRSILPEGMRPSELLDIFSVVAAIASQALDEIDVRTEIEDQRKKMQKKFEDVDTLAKGAVHAFLGRLSTVSMAIDIARTYPDKADKFLDKAKRSLQETVAYTRQYFSTVKEGNYEIRIEKKQTDLPGLVKTVEEAYNIREKQDLSAEHAIKVVVENELPNFLITDENKVMDMIYELVNNAKKYSPKGSEIAIIFRSLKEQESIRAVEIEVADQGVGLTPEQASRLFKEGNLRFHPELANGNSSGHGLYICNKVVRMLGGSMRVVSEVAKGSRFIFSLPLDSD